MTLETFRDYCLSLKGTTESLPFDNKTLVFKVVNKIFAFGDMENLESIALKCDPEKAIELRAQYGCVQPGWHLNKKHWNSVFLNGELDDKSVKALILHSYECVIKGLPKKIREEFMQS